MNKARYVTLTVPAHAEFVDLIRLTLYGIASKMEFSFEEIEDMKVAVSEAVNNVILHAYGDMEGEMEIVFAPSAEELSIVVRDRGASFAPVGVPESGSPLHGKSIDEIQSGGLGLYLMQALMDTVEIKQNGGTSVTLTKKRARSEEIA